MTTRLFHMDPPAGRVLACTIAVWPAPPGSGAVEAEADRSTILAGSAGVPDTVALAIMGHSAVTMLRHYQGGGK